MKSVLISDKMQKNYKYQLSESIGKNFNKDFYPELTPKEMLELGVFGGKYMTDCRKEFPSSWYKKAKLPPKKKNSKLNYFKIAASQSLAIWRKKGWINQHHDPRGWFQWYCRYYMGRRLSEEDECQIKRWKSYKRHLIQVKRNCKKKDLKCRLKQRQSLLYWAYDSRKI